MSKIVQGICLRLLPGLVLLTSAGARAHDGSSALSTGQVLRSWTLNLWVLAAVGTASLLYLRGRALQRQRAAGTPAPHQLEDAAFSISMLSLLLALISPLDYLSDLTFSAHMLQHELLMLLSAPMLVLARPLPVYLRALPGRLRSPAIRLLRVPSLVTAFRLLSSPVLALLVHGLIRWLWHLPLLFEATLENEWIHGVQHASFFLSALLFWWGLLQGRYGRAGYGMSFLFVLLTAMHTGALGALLSFSQHAWYPRYEARAQDIRLDAVFDQQIAGLIMWVGAGVWMMLLGLALFLAWLGEARRRSAHGSVAALQSTRGAAP